MIRRILLGVIVVLIALVGATAWVHRDLSPEALEAKYLQPNDMFVDAAGVRARVRVDGADDAPALVLLHGFTDSLETWEAWAEQLKADFRVIRVDLPAHGLTGPDPEGRYGPSDHAAFVVAVMDAMDVESAHVAGNSMGGRAAWRLAVDYPDRVNHLVLLNPAVFPLEGNEPPQLAASFVLRLAPDAAVRAAYDTALADPSIIGPEVIERARDMWRRRGNGGGMARTVAATLDLPDPSEDLRTITAPTMILWGGKDEIIPVEHGRETALLIRAARLTTFNDIGHMPQLEAPEQSAAIARAFLIGG